jgi:hypothetical protein
LKPPLRAAFLLEASCRGFSCSGLFLVIFFLVIRGEGAKVFNTTVENSVEKRGSILVSDSASDGSPLCTGVSAGTVVLRPSARGAWFLILN